MPLNFLENDDQKQPSIGGKGFAKIRSKFTGEHPCRIVISIKLQSNVIEITLWHGYSPVNLLHISRTSFPKNTYGGLLLDDPATDSLNQSSCANDIFSFFYQILSQESPNIH